jgi:hypothetical protein
MSEQNFSNESIARDISSPDSVKTSSGIIIPGGSGTNSSRGDKKEYDI